jgi:O-antigen/teichoic acid export membrane protein
VVVVGALVLLSAWAVPRAFGSGFEDAVPALWRLAPGTVFLALNRVLGDILRGRGRPTAVTAAEAVGALCTVSLLIAYVPKYGINGAATVSSVAYFTVFALLAFALWKARRQSERQPV